jgi:hypothetical protein
MAIIRAPRPDTGWYALARNIAEDHRLGWAARGLLVYLLQKPDDWRVSVSALVNETSAARLPTRRDGIYSLLQELVAAGYLQRHQARGGAGRLNEIDYTVHEQPSDKPPLTAQPDTAQPYTARPDTADPTLPKTEINQGLKKPKRAAARPALPDWIPADAWAAFVDMRREIRAKLTPAAEIHTIHELDKLRQAGHDPGAVLLQSVQRSWRGVFPLRGEPLTSAKPGRHSGNAAALDEFLRGVGQ